MLRIVVLIVVAIPLGGQPVLAQLTTSGRDAAGYLNLMMKNRPRYKLDAEKPGHYELIVQIDRPIISPGDTINIEMFMSGYGDVGGSKIVVERLPPIFDYDSSYLFSMEFSTIGKFPHSTFKLNYAKTTLPTPLVITFGGFDHPGWERPSFYVDEDTTEGFGPLEIETESTGPNAPFTVHLKTRKDIEPGTYSFPVVYTYFNGQKWEGQQQVITFKVKDFVERNITWITLLGLFLAFIAIVPLIGDQFKRVFVALKRGGLAIRQFYIAQMKSPQPKHTSATLAARKKRRP